MPRKAYSEQEREQVREKLLTTVIRLIVERGLTHSSVELLCKEVGISKTFFYFLFPSKEELVLQALRLTTKSGRRPGAARLFAAFSRPVSSAPVAVAAGRVLIF